MNYSVQLRWIAEAEARSVREIARHRQADLSPCNRPTVRGRLGWLRRLVPRLVWDFPTDGDCQRALVTVLITDIVDSTRLVVDIGDQQWRALLDRHDDAVRLQIRRHGGREIQNCGDGFLSHLRYPGACRPLYRGDRCLRRTTRPLSALRRPCRRDRPQRQRDQRHRR